MSADSLGASTTERMKGAFPGVFPGNDDARVAFIGSGVFAACPIPANVTLGEFKGVCTKRRSGKCVVSIPANKGIDRPEIRLDGENSGFWTAAVNHATDERVNVCLLADNVRHGEGRWAVMICTMSEIACGAELRLNYHGGSPPLKGNWSGLPA